MDIINHDKLLALYGSDETSLDIIHMFIDQSPKLINDIKLAVEEQNLEHLKMLCHKGIGQSRYIAAVPIEQILTELPTTSAEEQAELITQLIEHINQIANAYQ